MHKLVVFVFLLALSFTQAQELNCSVKVNSERITSANQQIFKTLETSLNEFVNKSKWSTREFKNNERIDCSMFINVSEFNNNVFTATIQVQASRPVLNSTYSTPILNVNDKDFTFRYVEFENLFFNPNSFDSNLVSVVAFYAYMILALDADSFEPQGGNEYLEIAQNIVSVSQSGGKGWSQSDGLQNRFFLVNDMLSNTFDPIRLGFYEYHTQGLDLMANDLPRGKEGVKNAILTLSKINSVRPNAYLTRVFFDTKADEILFVFSGGPKVDITDLVDNLNRVSPLNASNWSKIKF
ncbi:MAG TPA: DUF4835 family protein [Flavobacterium sp.]|uniref:type IX secretion system protein PorD n=1 Tax=unclassified Flavobacterium TaxID=196869 RepID=UPI0025BD3342|nr:MULTISPECIES: DUF4835 family protein [unclassified Flavobacterium]HRE77062.1 DUF4835 family protein [Flavobacterium sp.]